MLVSYNNLLINLYFPFFCLFSCVFLFRLVYYQFWAFLQFSVYHFRQPLASHSREEVICYLREEIAGYTWSRNVFPRLDVEIHRHLPRQGSRSNNPPKMVVTAISSSAELLAIFLCLSQVYSGLFTEARNQYACKELRFHLKLLLKYRIIHRIF